MDEWLAFPENQQFLYDVGIEVLEQLAPDEIPIFEELLPQYVELAQKGKVKVGRSKDEIFGFGDLADLLAAYLIPASASLLGAFLLYHGLKRVSEIKNKHLEGDANFMPAQPQSSPKEPPVTQTLKNAFNKRLKPSE